jgi:hypothetical protein
MQIDPELRFRIRFFLVAAILASLPCYCLGFTMAQLARSQETEQTPTNSGAATLTPGLTSTPTSLIQVTPTPTVPRPSPTVNPTLTQTLTPSSTPTMFSTFTPTFTIPPPESPTATSTEPIFITPTDNPSPTPEITLATSETPTTPYP